MNKILQKSFRSLKPPKKAKVFNRVSLFLREEMSLIFNAIFFSLSLSVENHLFLLRETLDGGADEGVGVTQKEGGQIGCLFEALG